MQIKVHSNEYEKKYEKTHAFDWKLLFPFIYYVLMFFFYYYFCLGKMAYMLNRKPQL